MIEHYELSRPDNEPTNKHLDRISRLLTEHTELVSETEIRNFIFQELVIDVLCDQFATEMTSSGIPPDVSSEFALQLDALEDRKLITQLLAVPLEIRSTLLQRFVSKKLSANEIIMELIGRVNRAKRNPTIGQPILGYHTTNNRIKKLRHIDRITNTEITAWNVVGLEYSDWGNTPMAYAARKYQDLYREKSARYLYVVVDRENTPIDRTTGWSHASGFPIIAEINLATIDNAVVEHFSRADLQAA